MLMVLVGNGPSAPGYAEDIDQANCVVRCNVAKLGPAGRKWDVWCFSGSKLMQKLSREVGLFDAPDTPKVAWCIRDRKIAEKGCKRLFPDSKREYLPEANLVRLERALNPKRKISPSTGFMALEMCLVHKPTRLAIVGFDATGYRGATAGHGPHTSAGWQPWKARGRPHDFAREKELIACWARTRIFCGQEYPETEPEWWR